MHQEQQQNCMACMGAFTMDGKGVKKRETSAGLVKKHQNIKVVSPTQFRCRDHTLSVNISVFTPLMVVPV